MNMKIYIVFLILSLLFLSNYTIASDAEKQEKKVLIISSFNDKSPETEKIIREIRDGFNQLPMPVKIQFSVLNALENVNDKDLSNVFSRIKSRIEVGFFDLVVAINDDAVDLMLKNYSIKPPQVQFVFCGYEKYSPKLHEQYANLTGVTRNYAIQKNIDLGMKLLPKTKEVVIIYALDHYGETPDAIKNLQLPPQVKLHKIDNKNFNTKKMLNFLRTMPQDSFTLFVNWRRMHAGEYYSAHGLMLEINRNSPGPTLISSEIFFLDKALGGWINSATAQGKTASAMINEILMKNNNAAMIPVRKSDLNPVFNHRSLSRWNIAEQNLPQNSIVINRPNSFLVRHIEVILLGALFSVLLLLIGAILALQYRKITRRNMAIFQSLPVRICVIDRNGKLLFVHSSDHSDKLLRQFKNISDLPGFDMNKIYAGIEKVFTTSRPLNMDYQIKKRKRSLSISMLPKNIFNKEAVIWVSQDVTELQELRHEQSLMAERLKITLQSIGDGVIATDNQGVITLLNRAAAAMINITPEAAVGRSLSEIFKTDTGSFTWGNTTVSQLDLSLRTGRSIESATDTWLNSLDGKRYYISEKASIMRDDMNAVIGGVLVFRDTTKEYNQQLKLNNYIDNERIINNCLSRIVFEASFEKNIATILNAISSQLKCDRAWFGVYSKSSGVFKVLYEKLRNDTSPLPNDLEDTYCQHLEKMLGALEHDVLLVISDAENSPYTEMAKALHTKSMIVAPVKFNSDIMGIICVSFTRESRTFSEIDENIMRSAARIAAMAKEHERQRNEVAAANLEKRVVFNNIPIPIWLYDKHGNLLRVNPAVEQLCNSTEEKIIAAAKSGENTQIQETLRYRQKISREHSFNGKEYIITSDPVLDEHGNLLYIIDSAINVTQINENQRKLEKAILAAQAADRAKSYFLATMSHELRTPLNAVIGFSELLQNKNIPENDRNEYLYAINISGNALLNLINDVLDLSKLEADQMDLLPEKTDFKQLCQELCSIFLLKAKEKHLNFDLICPILPLIYIDGLRIKQVLLNLIGNAVKFTEKGGICVNCSFDRLSGEFGTLSIKIIDSGCGISEEFQNKIFEPFIQQNTVRGAKSSEGTGLGLAISYRLVKRMKGEIKLKSELGKGSVFTIEIPNVKYEEDDGSLKKISTGQIKLEPDFSVLIVDDVLINCKVLQAMFNKMNIKNYLADSAASALNLLKNHTPDMILTDLWMPDMNGAQLAEAIRKMPNQHGMIFAVTADTEARNNFPINGVFDGVLLKPISIEKLCQTLQKVRKHTEK